MTDLVKMDITFPLFPYKTAKLLRVAATAGWLPPSVFSLIDNASFSKLAASRYLFWSRYTEKNIRKKSIINRHTQIESPKLIHRESDRSEIFFYKPSANIFSIVATSGWSLPDVRSRSSKACLQRGTATSYLPAEAYLNVLLGTQTSNSG